MRLTKGKVRVVLSIEYAHDRLAHIGVSDPTTQVFGVCDGHYTQRILRLFFSAYSQLDLRRNEERSTGYP
jgi:hypothetical protein